MYKIKWALFLLAFIPTSAAAQENGQRPGVVPRLLLDVDFIAFGPHAAAVPELSLGMEWEHQTQPNRVGFKLNYGNGFEDVLPVPDSGDYNGNYQVYSVDFTYDHDFYRWFGKHDVSRIPGEERNALFFSTGVSAAYGKQHITTLHTWTGELPLNEQKYFRSLGLRLGLGYRYTFPNKIAFTYLPVAITYGTAYSWSRWQGAQVGPYFGVLAFRGHDFMLHIPLSALF